MVVLQELQVGWFFKGRVFLGRWNANSFQRTRWKSADPTVHRPIMALFVWMMVLYILMRFAYITMMLVWLKARYFHCLLLNSMVPWPYIFNWVDFIVSLTAARVDGWPLTPPKKQKREYAWQSALGDAQTTLSITHPAWQPNHCFGRGMTSTTSSKRTAMLCSRMVTWKKIGFSWDPEGPGERKLGEFFRIFQFERVPIYFGLSKVWFVKVPVVPPSLP